MEVKRIKDFADRVIKLEEEKKSIADDLKQVFTEAKDSGMNMKAFREMLKFMKMDDADRNEFDVYLEQYRSAMGIERQAEMDFDANGNEVPNEDDAANDTLAA